MVSRTNLAANLRLHQTMRLLEPLWRWSSGSQDEGSAPAASSQQQTKKDVRFHGRCKILCPVTLAWMDTDGRTRRMNVRGVDMSGAGVCVESSKPVAPGSKVYVQVKQLNLMGTGVVRHCRVRGSKYRIGLEFPNPLTSTL